MSENKEKEAYVYREGKLIKKGVVSGYTTAGVFVWDPKEKAERPETAEWFPFNCKCIKTSVES